jgi:hypothetical protein
MLIGPFPSGLIDDVCHPPLTVLQMQWPERFHDAGTPCPLSIPVAVPTPRQVAPYLLKIGIHDSIWQKADSTLLNSAEWQKLCSL